jgi:hypothetical protein
VPLLSDIDHFIAVCVEHSAAFRHQGGMGFVGGFFEAESLYCPGCGDLRRMRVFPMSPVRPGGHSDALNLADTSTAAIAPQLVPAVLMLQCLQDHTRFVALLFRGPAEREKHGRRVYGSCAFVRIRRSNP